MGIAHHALTKGSLSSQIKPLPVIECGRALFTERIPSSGMAQSVASSVHLLVLYEADLTACLLI